ncbi:MAG: hypothetical protein H0U76_27745, partial [Ktedonobacteraceae bacterium]|nr:hypothetical protein [Ktedonobacteraceae bacterium]
MRPVPASQVATIAEMQGVIRDFRSGAGIVQVLRGVNLRVEPGEFVA